MIRLKNISKDLGEFRLSDISFEVDSGSYTVILGDSGSGKSLLLEILAGIRYADRGEISVDGEEIQYKTIQERPFGLVFQDLALFPHLTVKQNLAYPFKVRKTDGVTREAGIKELAEKLAITHLLERYPGSLSGGEKQRVALARTLAIRPACLLLDEPLSSLDARIRKEIRSLLRWINNEGQTIIHVTHDYQEALALASHIGIMEAGRLIQFDRAETVLRDPVNTFTASFTGIRNFIHVRLEKEPLASTVKAVTDQGIAISIDTRKTGGHGFLIIPEEAVFLSRSLVDTSAANTFQGKITEIIPAPHGMEVVIDIGFPVYALLTSEGVQRLGLAPGEFVWANFKATALRFIKK